MLMRSYDIIVEVVVGLISSLGTGGPKGRLLFFTLKFMTMATTAVTFRVFPTSFAASTQIIQTTLIQNGMIVDVVAVHHVANMIIGYAT